MNKTKTDGIVLSLIASFCGATVPIFSKLILQYVTPQVALFYRMFTALLIISVLVFVIIKPKVEINKTTLSITVFGALNFVFFMFGIKFMPAVLAPIFFSLVPIEVTLFSYLFYREKITLIKLSGIFLGYFGALVVLYPTFSGTSTDDVKPIGAVILLIASCSIALFSMLIQKSNDRYSTYNLSFQSIALAFLFSIPMLFLPGNSSGDLKGFDYKLFLFVLGVAIIGTIGQYVVFQNAISKIKASTNVIFFYFQPLFVIALSLVFLDEQVGLYYFVGLAFVLIGSSMNLGVISKLKKTYQNRKTIVS